MVSSGMLRHVALVRATWRNIPEDTILHSHSRENLKSYKSQNVKCTSYEYDTGLHGRMLSAL
jgi:hypothetical protein